MGEACDCMCHKWSMFIKNSVLYKVVQARTQRQQMVIAIGWIYQAKSAESESAIAFIEMMSIKTTISIQFKVNKTHPKFNRFILLIAL